MRILTWNIRGNNGINLQRRGRVVEAIQAHSPDIMVLQEVAWLKDLHLDLIDRLAERGWTGAAYGGLPGSTHKKYGNLILARWPVEIDTSAWAPGVPWPSSLVRAVVHTPEPGLFIVHLLRRRIACCGGPSPSSARCDVL